MLENIKKYFLEYFLAGVVVFVLIIAWMLAYNEYAHPCKKYAEQATYSHPVYVKSGNIIIPVGGWMKKECLLR